MKIETCLIEEHQKDAFLNIYQFYIYEMSCFYEKQIGSSGLFDFDRGQFDKYWEQNQHWPYFVMINGNIAGFSLIRRYPDDREIYDIEQFFVLNQYKRRGVGFSVFQSLVSEYAGKWQIRVLPSNGPALCFWEDCIDRISGNSATKMQKQECGENIHFLYFEKYNDNK